MAWSFGRSINTLPEAVDRVCVASVFFFSSALGLEVSDWIDNVGQPADTSVVHDFTGTAGAGTAAAAPCWDSLCGSRICSGRCTCKVLSRKHSASSAQIALRLRSVCIRGLCVLTQSASAIAPTSVQGVAAIHTAEPLVTPALGRSVGTEKVQSRCTLGHEAVVGDDSFGVPVL